MSYIPDNSELLGNPNHVKKALKAPPEKKEK
jgi:hypothetical protein